MVFASIVTGLSAGAGGVFTLVHSSMIDAAAAGKASADASSSAAGGHIHNGDVGGFGQSNSGGINNIQITTGFNNVQQNSVSISAQGSFIINPPSQ